MIKNQSQRAYRPLRGRYALLGFKFTYAELPIPIPKSVATLLGIKNQTQQVF